MTNFKNCFKKTTNIIIFNNSLKYIVETNKLFKFWKMKLKKKQEFMTIQIQKKNVKMIIFKTISHSGLYKTLK